MLIERSHLARMSTFVGQISVYACCCFVGISFQISSPVALSPTRRPALIASFFFPSRSTRRHTSMVETTVKCQSSSCINGNPPSKLECPTCAKSVSCSRFARFAISSHVGSESQVRSFAGKSASRLVVRCLPLLGSLDHRNQLS